MRACADPAFWFRCLQVDGLMGGVQPALMHAALVRAATGLGSGSGAGGLMGPGSGFIVGGAGGLGQLLQGSAAPGSVPLVPPAQHLAHQARTHPSKAGALPSSDTTQL